MISIVSDSPVIGSLSPLALHLDASRVDRLASSARTALAALVAYLGVVMVLNLWAKISGRQQIRRVASALTPRIVGALLAGLVATAAPAGAQEAHSASSSTPGAGNLINGTDTPVMVMVDTPPGAKTSLPWMTLEPPTTRPSGPAEESTTPSAQEAGDTVERDASIHVVRPGEHLWSIAEEALRSAGSEPTNDQIRTYWVELMDVNRSNLVDPSNPDLIFPGQSLRLPPLG